MICFISFLLLWESARSMGHRSDTFTTHVLIDQNNHSYNDTVFKMIYYIFKILVDH